MKYFNKINSFFAKCGYCDKICRCNNHSYGFNCYEHDYLIISEDRYGISIFSSEFEICEERHTLETSLYDLKTRSLVICVTGAFPINPGNFEHYVKRFKSLVAFS